MKDIPCEVIRDLMPSYIDGLTGEKTNEIIKNHLSECPECRKILERMKGPDTEDQPEEREIREIDFMKKNRKRNRHIVLFSVLGAVIMFLTACILRFFAIGGTHNGDMVVAQKITVEDGYIHFFGDCMDSASVISGIKFEENEGVVTIKVRTALVSLFHKAGKEYTYRLKNAEQPVKQILLNGKIIWQDGELIRPLASEVYATRHPYMGDISANRNTAERLGTSVLLGAYDNQLKTAETPYRWTLRLQEDIDEHQASLKEYYMDSLAYVYLGMIENLDEVTFTYTVNGKEQIKTITAQDASEFFGQDIKDCYGSIGLLEALLEKTGL